MGGMFLMLKTKAIPAAITIAQSARLNTGQRGI
jgi:hypothetical protein